MVHSMTPRSGPRPLPVHLLNLAWTLLSWRAGLPSLNSASSLWKPSLAGPAAALSRDLAGVDPEAFAAAVAAEADARHRAFLDGVAAYRRHPWRRDLTEPPVIWREGTTRLLDYGDRDGAPPVLLVPSLINRCTILDLTPRRSLARSLARRGLRPLLVDWDAPGEAEREFRLDDYITRLERLLQAVGETMVVGYCMGGLLALALALRQPRLVRGLALLATPWDFHAPSNAQARLLQRLRPALDLAIRTAGGLAADVQNALFAGVDPANAARKFAAFAALKPNSRQARDFVAVEDWLNDGVPLVPKVAAECLDGWYGRNDPAAGRWLRPADLTVPTLLLVPGRDRIVPPESALALAKTLPKARCRIIAAGHIGMITGRLAPTKVYGPLARWLTIVAARQMTCPSATLPLKTTP